MSTNRYSIYVDGAAPNNQGGCMKGGIGIAVYDEDNDLMDTCSITINRATDNAELELMAFAKLIPNFIFHCLKVISVLVCIPCLTMPCKTTA